MRHTGIPRDEMQPGAAFDRCRVVLSGGREYSFDGISFTPDSLVGSYRVLREVGSEREGIRLEEVTHRYAVALREVDSVMVSERELRKGILYGVGIGILGGIVYVLASGGDDDDEDTAGGKPPPDTPIP